MKKTTRSYSEQVHIDGRIWGLLLFVLILGYTF